MVQPLWKTLWKFLKKKLKIEIPYDSAVLLLGIYLKKTKTLTQKDTPCSLLHYSQLAKTWKQPEYPSADECIKNVKLLYIIYIRILFCHKKKEILVFLPIWLELGGIMLSEVSHKEKNKYCMILLLYRI